MRFANPVSTIRRAAVYGGLASVGLGLAATVVVSAAAIPGPGRLVGLPGSGVDFVRQSSAVPPLRAAYVRQQLDLPQLRRHRAAGSAGQPASATARPDQGGAPGETLSHAFTNDSFEHAVVVRRLPFTATTDTARESRQPGEPSTCGSTGGTAWYRYRAQQPATLFADTFGTTYADNLGVFTGPRVSQLHNVACGSSLSGQAQAGFRAVQGETYWFRINGTIRGGRLQFHVVQLGRTAEPFGQPVAPTPALSANGKWLAFSASVPAESPAQRCVTTSGKCAGLFLTNLRAGHTRRLLLVGPVPPGPRGRDAGGNTETINDISISARGRYISFDSDDPDLVAGDTNSAIDVFTVDARSGRIERDSVASDGRQGSAPPVQMSLSYAPTAAVGAVIPTISADGRYVVFTSNLAGLSPQDANGSYAVYRHDRRTGRTDLVSVDLHHRALPHTAIRGGDVVAEARSMSANGRRIVFDYTLDRSSCFGTGTGTCAAQTWLWTARRRGARPIYVNGLTIDAGSTIAPDGRHVGLVLQPPSTTNTPVGDYKYAELDLATHRLRQVSITTSGRSGSAPTVGSLLGGTPFSPAITLSRNGRYVAFDSFAALVPGDTNGVADIYVRDMRAGSTARMSLNPSGGQRTADSYAEVISADGRTVSYLVASASGESGVLAGDPRMFVHHSSAPGAP